MKDVLLVRLSIGVRVQAEAGGGTAVFSFVGIGLLDQLVSHRALAGPEVTLLRALIARAAGDALV